MGSTPEASLGGSSHTSTSSAGQEKGQDECFLDEVLRGEEIDALLIREENLNKMVCVCAHTYMYMYINVCLETGKGECVCVLSLIHI